MNGVHDLGGTDGLGPVPVPPSEPVFRADWEKAVLATPRNTGHHKAHREPVAVDPAR